MQKKIESISPIVMKGLTTWEWPGNIRELENFIERAVIVTRGRSLEAPLEELRKTNTVAFQHVEQHNVERAAVEITGSQSDKASTADGYEKPARRGHTGANCVQRVRWWCIWCCGAPGSEPHDFDLADEEIRNLCEALCLSAARLIIQPSRVASGVLAVSWASGPWLYGIASCSNCGVGSQENASRIRDDPQ